MVSTGLIVVNLHATAESAFAAIVAVAAFAACY